MENNIQKKLLTIEKNLNNSLIGQENYLNSLCNYFLAKLKEDEKGSLLILGEKNTAKKTSIRLLFEYLKEENLINNGIIEEIDLASYDFNLGYNAFITDLYEKLNDPSECLMFRNLDKATEDIFEVLYSIHPNTCIPLKEEYVLKNRFLVEAALNDEDTIDNFICHNKFFVFISNDKDNEITTKFSENVDKILFTKDLTSEENYKVLKMDLLKIINQLENNFKIKISLDLSNDENNILKFLQNDYRNDSSFGIDKYIRYKIYHPINNLFLQNEIADGSSINLYVEYDDIFCKTDKEIYNLNNYYKPTFDEVCYKLNSMIGMKELKNFLYNIHNTLKVQTIREKLGMKTTNISMNMIFTGNAGTGKTNAARITFEYLNALKVLSKGIFKEVSKADFVSENLADTAKKTNDIINSALGGVLFIDEAYSLCKGEDDKIGIEIVDALLKGIEDNRDNIVVILAGYENDMNEFLSYNQGLKSRFPNKIHFSDYTPTEMYELSLNIAKSKGYRISSNVKNGLIDLFTKNQVKGKNDLGNARFVRNIIENAIVDASKKYLTNSNKEIDLLEKDNFNFKINAKFDLDEKLNNIIGLDEVKKLIRSQYKLIVAEEKRKSVGVVTRVNQNLNMVFAGNPGTGKTSIARLVAEMLNSIGLLKVGQLIETDRSSFVSEVPGETAKKTESKFKEAIGGILFIDEAYTLANDSLGREAIETLLKLIEDYSKDVIVILAGYEKEMEDFFDVNIGLRSRFPLWTNFEDYNANELFEMSIRLIEAQGFKLSKNADITLKKTFEEIYENSDSQSGNGRMVRNYVEKIIRNQSIRIAEEDISVYEMNLITAKDIESITSNSMNNGFDLETVLKNVTINEKSKEVLRNQYSLLKVTARRKKLGIRTNINRHLNMIITGDVGTGKKEFLNLLSEMYYSYGIVKAKSISELNGYEIISAISEGIDIEDILNKHLGKILFIYRINVILENPRYNEILISLTRFLENNKNKIIIALGGRTKDCKKLVTNNPYVNINFPIWLNFEDYNEIELLTSTIHALYEKMFTLEEEAHKELNNLISEIYKFNDLVLKNGLLVESLVESIIRNQSIRICNNSVIQTEINIINSKDILMCKDDFFTKNSIK
ncbi:AAA family ATPase [Clostridium sp. SHJSY1]|uniref:AAA family ATPase n=1 Tax=Clostridium sp. SHJSY1 TaxID=2942483 RepID=UPI0028753EC6|nr:AAA family ATPase [Clostridium sp. SHJSY1]MDS0524869.1 AAA family ATPase [Clostridium sp. SHJSY1]